MTGSLRILVTGSRNWRWPSVVRRELDQAVINYILCEDSAPDVVTVVHGAAGGVDSIAGGYARSRRWVPEPHPADWAGPCLGACPVGHRKADKRGGTYCPLAGHYRNQRMVDLGADLVLVFQRDHSSGTDDCARRARAAGLAVVPFLDCVCHPVGVTGHR